MGLYGCTFLGTDLIKIVGDFKKIRLLLFYSLMIHGIQNIMPQQQKNFMILWIYLFWKSGNYKSKVLATMGCPCTVTFDGYFLSMRCRSMLSIICRHKVGPWWLFICPSSLGLWWLPSVHALWVYDDYFLFIHCESMMAIVCPCSVSL